MNHDLLVEVMKLDTKSLIYSKERAVTFNEAVEELREAYDEELGLDTGNSHALMSTYENPLQDSLYERWARVYQEKQIFKYWKVPFTEWLNQPRWKMAVQIRIADERARVEDEVARNIIEEDKNKKG